MEPTGFLTLELLKLFKILVKSELSVDCGIKHSESTKQKRPANVAKGMLYIFVSMLQVDAQINSVETGLMVSCPANRWYADYPDWHGLVEIGGLWIFPTLRDKCLKWFLFQCLKWHETTPLLWVKNFPLPIMHVPKQKSVQLQPTGTNSL